MKVFPISKQENEKFRFTTKDGQVNLYDFLKIHPSVPIEEIRKQYQTLRSLFDIDSINSGSSSGVGDNEHETVKRVIESYSILTNTRLKSVYDNNILHRINYHQNLGHTAVNLSAMMVKKIFEISHFLCNISPPDSRGPLMGLVKVVGAGAIPAVKRSLCSVFWTLQIPVDTMLRVVFGPYYNIAEAAIFYPASYLIPSLLIGCPSHFGPQLFIKSLLIDPVSNQIAWTRVWYGFGLFLVRRSLFYHLEEALVWCKRKAQTLYIRDLNSTPRAIANAILSSYVWRSIAFAVIVNPIQIVMHQYQMTAFGVGSPQAILSARQGYWAFTKHIYKTLGPKQLFFLNAGLLPGIMIHYIYYHYNDIFTQFFGEEETTNKSS
ncbi:hypothetical protein CYY_004262 [Polysphondylium violaceum]|uniref:J domain-containing protein n=1 Tax=Polysphondylium violaceum TaxID=133409 RepID=A0A8J4UZC9_9MYCE|nr:hypothetical protein CYY_004262 [Polysphondylium violaceum]